mgnify:CR=1 FL=1
MLFAAMAVITMSAQAYQPAKCPLMTEWGEKVTPENAWREYPRPQMVRGNWTNLNGEWDYAVTSVTNTPGRPEKWDGKILVPFAIESALSGVGKLLEPDQFLWYSRKIECRPNPGERVLLHFGGVDFRTMVFIGHKEVTDVPHEGGQNPFTLDITDYVTEGENELTVCVWDPTENFVNSRGKQSFKPHGCFYTRVSGIWQTVWMEPVEKTHVADFYASSDIDAGLVNVDVDAAGLQDGDEVTVKLLDGSKEIATAIGANVSIPVDGMKLWTPDSPFLYGINVTIERDGKVIDSVDGYTACRKISVMRDEKNINGYKRLALNNEIMFQFGPLDQGWWPDGLYTAPCDEALRFDIEKTKEMGFNMIRKHTKVEPSRWYYWCDVLGIVVWQDMPAIADGASEEETGRSEEVVKHQQHSWSSDSFMNPTEANIPAQWKENYYREWAEIIAQFKHFPSIVVWVPFNEAWGQFDTKKVVEFTRAQDPTRLVNESSGGNYFFAGDIIDIHHYPQPAMNAFESRFVMVLGEYGGIGRAVPGHTWHENAGWGYGGLKDAEQAQNNYVYYTEMLKEFVKTGCSAAVYTQTTDCEGELNGLLTYDRKVEKFDYSVINKANTSVINSLK